MNKLISILIVITLLITFILAFHGEPGRRESRQTEPSDTVRVNTYLIQNDSIDIFVPTNEKVDDSVIINSFIFQNRELWCEHVEWYSLSDTNNALLSWDEMKNLQAESPMCAIGIGRDAMEGLSMGLFHYGDDLAEYTWGELYDSQKTEYCMSFLNDCAAATALFDDTIVSTPFHTIYKEYGNPTTIRTTETQTTMLYIAQDVQMNIYILPLDGVYEITVAFIPSAESTKAAKS